MSPPTLSASFLYILILLLSWFVGSLLSTPLSTIAISHLNDNNVTIVCALLPASPAKGRYDLNCTAFPSGRQRSYPSSFRAPYTAIAAGNGFLCALSSPRSYNTSTMRWWDFARAVANRSSSVDSKRIYQGGVLDRLDSGDVHVCGLQGDTRELYCWRWPQLSVPGQVKMVDIAVGGDFVCGLRSDGRIKCFGGDEGVVGKEPEGNYSVVAAGSRHACGISEGGGLACWGVGAPSVGKTAVGIDALALGANRTCAIRANGTVVCWGEGLTLPEDVACAQFIAIEAKGNAFCGILTANFSLVCWGSRVFRGKHVVYERALPGTCKAISSCACGVVPGSANICVAGGICQSCQQLANSPPEPPPFAMPNSTTPSDGSKRNSIIIPIVIGSVALAIGLAALACYTLFQLSKKSGRIHDSGRLNNGAPPPPTEQRAEQPPIDRRLSVLLSRGQNSSIEQFPLKSLLDATKGFSEDHKVGSGSFGTVYRATLSDGRHVAIKRAETPASTSHAAALGDRKNKDREFAFLSELALLSRVNHKNLVRLLGYSVEDLERVLVYEFMPNGSLHDHLHKQPALSPPLASWPARIRVALDAARGIEYLHTYAVPPIIHRDIKSSNILLDGAWVAKVSDFGLSLMHLDSDEDSQEEEEEKQEEAIRAAGTVGYMDPEYYRLQNLTAKSDVYSFGVVLLELLTGCKVIHRYEDSNTPRNVVEFAVPEIIKDRVHDVLDRRLPPPSPSEIEVVAYVGYLAADCVSLVGRNRPTMTDVVAALERAVAACSTAPATVPPLSRSATSRSV